MTTTSLKALKKAGACRDRYNYLKESLNDYRGDQPLLYSDILNINGINDTFWALRNTLNNDNLLKRIAVEFACDCAEHVLPFFEKQFPGDKRPQEAISMARLFLSPNPPGRQELDAAGDAAGAAAWAAARDAAWAAAGAAAWAAAGAAAGAAAWDAAGDAEKKWQTDRLMEILKKEGL